VAGADFFIIFFEPELDLIDLIYSYSVGGIAHADLLSSYMKRRKTLRGINTFLILLVQLLPLELAVFCCTKIDVQLSRRLGWKAPMGRGSPWPFGTGQVTLFQSPIWLPSVSL
jgi:hypothetical protein